MFNNKQKKVNKYVLIILLLIVLILGFWIVKNHYYYEDKFANPNILKKEIPAEIIKYEPVGRGNPIFHYVFFINDKKYLSKHFITNPNIYNKSRVELEEYVGKKYYAIYVVDDPFLSKLLLEKPI